MNYYVYLHRNKWDVEPKKLVIDNQNPKQVSGHKVNNLLSAF